jgi:uncharacterized protein (TIGR03663 family)
VAGDVDWRDSEIGSLRRFEVDRWTWKIVATWIVLAATLLRLYDLDLKPLHHDEGVNGLFLTNLVSISGTYRYDPANYHGPTLYYFALASVKAFGLTTFAIRFVPALLGILTVLLVLAFRKGIGPVGTLSAAALVGFSPGAVYFSRYFIHETLLVFFTLTTVAMFARYVEKRERWTLVLASASVGFMFATKETAIITASVLTVAGIATRMCFGLDRGWRVPIVLGTRGHLLLAAIVALPFLIVIVLFYSSFLTNSQGVADAFRSFAVWSRTGARAHVHPWATYLNWLWVEEAPILITAGVGMAVALWRHDNAFAVFVTIWAFVVLAVYSLIPYKTPWLTLNLIVPFALVAGYGLDMVWTRGHGRLAAVVVILLLTVALYQAISVAFVHYDDEAYPYVYVHTKRDVIELVKQIDRISNLSHGHSPVSIAVTSPEHFPLSWYLRYYRTGFYGHIVQVQDPVVIGSEYQVQALQSVLGDEYQRTGTYLLRPGVRLVLYIRRNVVHP